MKKNIIFVGVTVCLLVLLGIGFSYSMWNMSVSQDTSNVIATTSECFNIEITNQSNAINLENAYPISNEKGKKLTPFTFTVKNTCDMFLSYTVSLESLKGSTLNSKFIDVMVNNEAVTRLSEYETTETVNNESVEARILAKGSLSKDDSNDYSLRLWIDYDTTMEDLDNETKVLKAKVVIKAVPSNWDPVSEGYTTLHDAILANEYQTTPAKAVEKIKAKGTPDFSETAPFITYEQTTLEETTIEIVKPAESSIKSDDATSDLMTKDTILWLGKAYTYDKTKNVYNIADGVYIDPTTIDYNGDIKYYTRIETTYVSDGKIATTYGYADVTTIYQLVGATKKSTKTTWNGKEYDSITYTLNVIPHSLKEIESDKSDKGLYKDVDDYGDTYYYRGNVLNNNVYFAGFYWKIIRINGDGTIRLLYNGEKPNSSGVDSAILWTQYSNKKDNAAYLGYMYGNSVDILDNAFKNEVNSNIKEQIDKWYQNNLTNYTNYLSDSGFCNDRSISSGSTPTGYVIFNAYDRLIINKTPTFKCSNGSRDLFTVTNTTGNKALTYPIGLITADETLYAGIVDSKPNDNNYLHTYVWNWTMTPIKYNYPYLTTYTYGNNNAASLPTSATSSYYVRPVISLKADVKITGGIGTSNSPFIIETK